MVRDIIRDIIRDVVRDLLRDLVRELVRVRDDGALEAIVEDTLEPIVEGTLQPIVEVALKQGTLNNGVLTIQHKENGTRDKSYLGKIYLKINRNP